MFIVLECQDFEIIAIQKYTLFYGYPTEFYKYKPRSSEDSDGPQIHSGIGFRGNKQKRNRVVWSVAHAIKVLFLFRQKDLS